MLLVLWRSIHCSKLREVFEKGQKVEDWTVMDSSEGGGLLGSHGRDVMMMLDDSLQASQRYYLRESRFEVGRSSVENSPSHPDPWLLVRLDQVVCNDLEVVLIRCSGVRKLRV